MMLRASLSLSTIIALAACSSPTEDATTASGEADVTSAQSFIACGSALAGDENVLFSPDGARAAYVACQIGDHDAGGTLRIVDLATKKITDVEPVSAIGKLVATPDGKGFTMLAGFTLRLYAWDGSAPKVFTDVHELAFSPDGKRLVTYKQERNRVGATNGYRLSVHVRGLDDGSDISGVFEEDRGGNLVTGDAAVMGVAFAPDKSHIAFIRKYADYYNQAFATKFDLATKTFSTWKTYSMYIRDVFPETYDGSAMAFIEADNTGARRFVYGSIGDIRYSAPLFNHDPSKYYGVFCAVREGSGGFLFWTQPKTPFGSPVTLTHWDATSGAKALTSLADQAPDLPVECPILGPNGDYAYYATRTWRRPNKTAVLALKEGATQMVIADSWIMPGPHSLIAHPRGVVSKPLWIDPVTGATEELKTPTDEAADVATVSKGFLSDRSYAFVTETAKTVDGVPMKARSLSVSSGATFTKLADLGERRALAYAEGPKIGLLPDGKRIALTRNIGDYQAEVFVVAP